MTYICSKWTSIQIHMQHRKIRIWKLRGSIQKFPDWVITKYKRTFGITHWEAIQRVMTAKLTRLTHKIEIQLHLLAESCIIWSSRSRWSVWKLLDIPFYVYRKFEYTFQLLLHSKQNRSKYPDVGLRFVCSLQSVLDVMDTWSLGHGFLVVHLTDF
jgi:hypothetical protein